MKTIAVFIGRSLLIQGALSYFQSHTESNIEALPLEVANTQEALTRLKTIVPDIVVVDAQCVFSHTSLCPASILELFPHLIVMELQVDSPTVRIFRSEQRKPATFEELISTIKVEEQHALPVKSFEAVEMP